MATEDLDSEIAAMSAISNALTDMDPDAQGRVLRWAGERFGVTIDAGKKQSGGRDEVVEDEVVDESPAFGSFAELFAAADPKSNEEKALIAAYWVQVHQGNDTWQSRPLNAMLKQAGHHIANITDALTKNMKKRPQRVVQMGKAGNAKQANKTYKITTEGIGYVQGMLGSGDA